MSKSILKSVFLLLTFASAYGQVKTLELPHKQLKHSCNIKGEQWNVMGGYRRRVEFDLW